MKTLALSFSTLVLPLALSAQVEIVPLQNPSFEESAEGKMEHWIDCGFEGESMPDIQPGIFGCSMKAQHGKTYLGMATRPANTWERVCQTLKKPLIKDSTYLFAIRLAASPEYLSQTRESVKKINFNDPVVLRVWGMSLTENEAELLAETPPVDHHRWKTYSLTLKPLAYDMEKIVLEAYYPDPKQKTAGNLLLDNATDFYPTSMGAAFESAKQTESRKAREGIALQNPSFEIRMQGHFHLPPNWVDLGNGPKTIYRTHPFDPKAYSALAAIEGQHYASLIARKDGRRQSLSQVLDHPLQKDSAYTFSLQLSKGKHFVDGEAVYDKIHDYENPLRLLVWGGTEEQPFSQLLATSKTIKRTTWEKIHFVLKPDQDWYVLTLEADYDSKIDKTYNGHILLDDCSRIEKIRR